jgi:hypothetical protein
MALLQWRPSTLQKHGQVCLAGNPLRSPSAQSHCRARSLAWSPALLCHALQIKIGAPFPRAVQETDETQIWDATTTSMAASPRRIQR